MQHWLAILLFTAYTAMLLINAYIGRKASTDMEAYYVGGRKMGGLAIGISFFATFASTNSYIGHAGKGYEYGIPWLFMAATLVIFTYVSWRWIAPRLRRFAAAFDALTLPDYLGSRFVTSGDDHPAHPLRLASATVIVFASLLYLIAIFKGAGHLFQMFLDIGYKAAIAITLVIVVLYTSVGGFISVVRTDVVQGLLMIMGSLLLFYFITDAAGGVGSIMTLREQPDTAHLFELNAGIPFAVLVGISLSGALKLIVDPRQISRFYALQDDRAIRIGVWVSVIGLILVMFAVFPIGVYARLLLDNVTDTDLIVPTLVADPDVFPIWAGDFLIVAIVAAAMSSIDSVLLVAASTLFKNLIAPLGRSDERQETHWGLSDVQWTRLAVVVIAVVAAGLALNPPGDIVEITIFSGSLYAACFFPAVVLGLYWQRGSSQSVLWSMAAGSLVLGAWMLSGLGAILHEVFPALLVSLVVYIGVAKATPIRPIEASMGSS
jgi:SSS family transporter